MFTSVWAKITKAGNSATNWFLQQITYKGRVSDCVIVFPYGYHANAKVDKSIVLVFGVGGDSENKAGIAWDPFNRPDLVEGEVAIYLPETNTFIKLGVDENITINTDKDIIATCANATITANADITATCVNAEITASADATVNAVNVNINATTAATITAPIITLDGNVIGTGTLSNTSGAASFGSTVTSGGVDIGGTHTHTGSPTAPDGPQSNTGAPV